MPLVVHRVHRYIFHMTTSSYWTNTFHCIFHGFHQKHPMDDARLVFPPAITAILATIVSIYLHALCSIDGFCVSNVTSLPLHFCYIC